MTHRADDIVERLRFPFSARTNTGAGVEICSDQWRAIMNEAADKIERLQNEHWQLKQALGYPIPADKETINNPFKCGTCDARILECEEWNGKHQQACLEIERLRATLQWVRAHSAEYETKKVVCEALYPEIARRALEDKPDG